MQNTIPEKKRWEARVSHHFISCDDNRYSSTACDQHWSKEQEYLIDLRKQSQSNHAVISKTQSDYWYSYLYPKDHLNRRTIIHIIETWNKDLIDLRKQSQSNHAVISKAQSDYWYSYLYPKDHLNRKGWKSFWRFGTRGIIVASEDFQHLLAKCFVLRVLDNPLYQKKISLFNNLHWSNLENSTVTTG